VASIAPRQSFGADDDTWVAAALLLQQYGDATGPDRERLAARLASYLASEGEITFVSAGLQMAGAIDEAGALHLATTWLTLLERLIPPARVLEFGRVLTYRARIARRLDANESARLLYEEVERLGETAAEPELTTRAWIGYANMARGRGNYPEARRWLHAAALVADDTGCAEQSALAHQGLLVDAAVARDFDRALIEGGIALRWAQGDTPREVEILNNLAQVLHDTGRHQAALRCFAATVARTTIPRLLLAALGGAATAGAALGSRQIVDAAAERIADLIPVGWVFPVSSALIELSEAYAMLGDSRAADDNRARGRLLAESHHFHELVYRADHPAKSAAPLAQLSQPGETGISISRAAAHVISTVEELSVAADLYIVL
jgi:tetratricopeptide (TPR) repeat protein